MSQTLTAIPSDYADWLAEIKTRVRAARSRAALAVNTELVALYWQIGHDILQRQSAQGWGSKVKRLARDLREAFPEMKGFSRANLLYMRAFAEVWPDEAIVQQLAGQLPWFHNVMLITRLKEHSVREWYAQRAIVEGWSRATLELQIRNRLHERQGQAITNFNVRLPAPHSQLADETLKDPYLFDFLGLSDDAHQRDIENALVRALPETLATSLPTVEDLEHELAVADFEPMAQIEQPEAVAANTTQTSKIKKTAPRQGGLFGDDE